MFPRPVMSRRCDESLRFAAKPWASRGAPAPSKINRAADPDPHTLHECNGKLRRDQAQRMPVKRQTIMAFVDAQCFGQFTRPGTKRFFNLRAAPQRHHAKSQCGLQSPQEHSVAGIADHVHAPVQPVRSVNITTTRRAKHCLIAQRWPRKAMRCRIIRLIGFCFYNDTADLPHTQKMADQIGSHFACRAGEKRCLDQDITLLKSQAYRFVVGSRL